MNVLACGEDDENARCGAGGGGAAPTKAAMAETQLALLPSLLPLLLPAPGACLDPGLPTHLVYPTTSPASLPRLLGFASGISNEEQKKTNALERGRKKE